MDLFFSFLNSTLQRNACQGREGRRPSPFPHCKSLQLSSILTAPNKIICSVGAPSSGRPSKSTIPFLRSMHFADWPISGSSSPVALLAGKLQRPRRPTLRTSRSRLTELPPPATTTTTTTTTQKTTVVVTRSSRAQKRKPKPRRTTS